MSDVKRYDRQIRLWGLETQRGLLGTRILLLEFTGTCNEILKNLVLAGVGHICIQDAADVAAAPNSTATTTAPRRLTTTGPIWLIIRAF